MTIHNALDLKDVTNALAQGQAPGFRLGVAAVPTLHDGLCTDHCPQVFVLLEDGISYVRDGAWVGNDPGGPECLVVVPDNAEHAVILAADDCPGECIFIEVDP